MLDLVMAAHHPTPESLSPAASRKHPKDGLVTLEACVVL